jgi:uncharacterized RDD family membrane protein YckC
MEQILDLPGSGQRKLNYAGFWIRFGAYFIDGIILQVVQVILAFGIFGGYSFTEPNYPLSGISFLIGLGYFVMMESSANQGTLGKMALGIRVGNENGDRISVANAIGRYFAKLVSTITLLIGFMMAGWDSKKQALHDKLADTYVYHV